MIKTIKNIISFYYENKRKPLIEDLDIENKDMLNTKNSLFITLYKGGEIRGSSGSINCVKDNTLEELIDLTISSLINDDRFDSVTKDEALQLNIRVDVIISREIITDPGNSDLINYIKDGVIAISKDHDKMAIILPNISGNINSLIDFKSVLSQKLDDNFEFDKYIIYKINTEIITDF